MGDVMSRINIHFSRLIEAANSTLVPFAIGVAGGSALTLSDPRGVAIALLSKEVFNLFVYKSKGLLPDRVKVIPSHGLPQAALILGQLATAYFIGYEVAHWTGYDTSITAMLAGSSVEVCYHLSRFIYINFFKENQSEETGYVTQVNKQNFEQEILKSKQPVILDAYASWCPPCRMMSPRFSELSQELNGRIKFAKLDVQEEGELAEKLNIQAMPTFIFFRDGYRVGTHRGALDKGKLREMIETKLLLNPLLIPGLGLKVHGVQKQSVQDR
jgi:thioredoxin